MIGFQNCFYQHSDGVEQRLILRDATLTFQRNEKICVFAHSGTGKSTILSMLRGQTAPESGHVGTDHSLSWPIGSAGAFHPAMTGEENILAIAKLCGLDAGMTSAYVFKFSELEEDYFYPLSTYSSGKRARLAYALSYAVPASMYLAEDSIGTGSIDYIAKCKSALLQKLKHAGLFLITRNPQIGKDIAERFFVLQNGTFVECGTFEDANDLFERADTHVSEIVDLVEGFYSSE